MHRLHSEKSDLQRQLAERGGIIEDLRGRLEQMYHEVEHLTNANLRKNKDLEDQLRNIGSRYESETLILPQMHERTTIFEPSTIMGGSPIRNQMNFASQSMPTVVPAPMQTVVQGPIQSVASAPIQTIGQIIRTSPYTAMPVQSIGPFYPSMGADVRRGNNIVSGGVQMGAAQRSYIPTSNSNANITFIPSSNIKTNNNYVVNQNTKSSNSRAGSVETKDRK